MLTTHSGLEVSDAILGQWQGAMIEALLTNSPLSGLSRPLNLPDLSLVLEESDVVVSSENLGGPVHVAGAIKPIYILSEDDIRRRTKYQGDFSYLQFQPPQAVRDDVLLTLQIRIAQKDPLKPTLGLSGIQVTFRQIGTSWQAAEETAEFAA